MIRAMKEDKKPFKESIWHNGKVVGIVKGDFKLQNMPAMQQMMLGVLTEKGIVMNAAPILLEEKDGSIFGIMKKQNKNEKIT